MLNNNKMLKTAVDNMRKISSSGVLKTIGGLCVSYYAVSYYVDVIRPTAKARVYAISHSTLQKQYESVRIKDVELIRKRLTLKPDELENNFSVLIGPQGIGKTVAIESAAEKLNGVIKVGSVRPGTTKDEIMNMVCYKITNRSGSYAENNTFMKEVVDLYRSLTGKVPVIIIQADLCLLNEKPAHISAAARNLVDFFGLNVFIDCSENAFPDSRTGREVMIELEPMSSDMMRQLPEFKDLLKFLKTQGDEEVVLAVCGGVPLILKQLNTKIKDKNPKNDEEKKKIARQFVIDQVISANDNIQSLVLACPKIKDVLKMYEGKANAQVTKQMLRDKLENVAMPDLKGVLRQLRHGYGEERELFLVPANGATAVLLRMGSLDSKPSFDEIKTAISMWHKQKENEENEVVEKGKK